MFQTDKMFDYPTLITIYIYLITSKFTLNTMMRIRHSNLYMNVCRSKWILIFHSTEVVYVTPTTTELQFEVQEKRTTEVSTTTTKITEKPKELTTIELQFKEAPKPEIPWRGPDDFEVVIERFEEVRVITSDEEVSEVTEEVTVVERLRPSVAEQVQLEFKQKPKRDVATLELEFAETPSPEITLAEGSLPVVVMVMAVLKRILLLEMLTNCWI